MVRVGLYPIATLQYSSTTLYQVSYHIQSLFSKVTIYNPRCVARRFADFAELREALLLPDVVPDLTARNTIMSTPFPPKTGLLESKIDQPLLHFLPARGYQMNGVWP